MKQYSITWQQGHYQEAFPNPHIVEENSIKGHFFTEEQGFTYSDYKEILELKVGESKMIDPGDIIIVRLFDTKEDSQAEERDLSCEDVMFIKEKILEHITTQVELRGDLIPSRLAESDSDNRLKQDIWAIEAWMKLYDFVSRDLLTLDENFDLAHNEIFDIKVLDRCLIHWMHWTNGCISDCLNHGVNSDIEYDDIPMFAEMLELTSHIRASYCILNEEE